MEETQQKQKLEIAPNEKYQIQLNDNEPFYTNNHAKFGLSHGYNVNVCKGEIKDGSHWLEKVWFASEALINIMQAAKVNKDKSFELMLKKGVKDDGNPYSVYELNGKSTNEWRQLSAVATATGDDVKRLFTKSEDEPTIPSNGEITMGDLKDTLDSINRTILDLEKSVNQKMDSMENMIQKMEGNIPF